MSRICSHCGEQIRDRARVCPNCGAHFDLALVPRGPQPDATLSSAQLRMNRHPEAKKLIERFLPTAVFVLLAVAVAYRGANRPALSYPASALCLMAAVLLTVHPEWTRRATFEYVMYAFLAVVVVLTLMSRGHFDWIAFFFICAPVPFERWRRARRERRKRLKEEREAPDHPPVGGAL